MNVYKLFPHQKEAISCLNKFFSVSKNESSLSGLLVIPTGGGKTFTAVTWINQIIEKRPKKVIWFAQSFELLNQAYYTIRNNNGNIKIKIISSNNEHMNVSDINENDDVIIITTQTAMKSLGKDDSKLSDYIKYNGRNGLIVILDEAHHAPARGCRNMLNKVKELAENVWMLGLTATPTYTNRMQRGWLWKIFDGGIVYQVEKELLQKQKILAKENIMRKKTPIRIELTDEEFNKIIRFHSDIPENIIEELAANKERNDYIVNDYLKNRKTYKKTIFFLDRWYQCIYFKNKLIEYGIKADTIYYQKRNEHSEKSNTEIINEFRNGELDVLLNIKMFTEGADIPDVNTVFITRDTTSHILLQQMIGRALRGKRAGGKKENANIVLFGDSWDKTIAWARPDLAGGIEEGRVHQVSYPMEKVSISLVRSLISNMTFKSVKIPNFKEKIPIGWYETEYVSIKNAEGERIEIVKDTVLVYEIDRQIWEELISNALVSLDDIWENEDIQDKALYVETQKLFDKYFNILHTSMNKGLFQDICNICRHIAQNSSSPRFYHFYDRDKCDIESIASNFINMTPNAQYNYLLKEYNEIGGVWPYLYEHFFHFKTAVDMYVNKLLFSREGVIENTSESSESLQLAMDSAQEKELIKAVKFRDNHTCLCCGLSNQGVRLVAAEILNYNFSQGKTMHNLQTLCTRCNFMNKENRYNFKVTRTSLVSPKLFTGITFDKQNIRNIVKIKAALKASINMFYECGAVHDVNISRRSNSKYYFNWEFTIFSGNHPEWLQRQLDSVLNYIVNDLEQTHVKNVTIKTL
ncbi:DEAD/DEAH box helicase [Petroclostridium sp. X23]|uniref:DEAD/DEAH box helicase n=1 Tax=Petroclostridium sp. X23 TaxID=3045146 RepID=UPI0024AD8887|nr:DEAD/DEAH box helicase [Petroclostridium sp. X23]WHH59483.1 DEAD/DEAH box helicase [Petroclostridium sp. X23]